MRKSGKAGDCTVEVLGIGKILMTKISLVVLLMY